MKLLSLIAVFVSLFVAAFYGGAAILVDSDRTVFWTVLSVWWLGIAIVWFFNYRTWDKIERLDKCDCDGCRP